MNHNETCFGLCMRSMNPDNDGGKVPGYKTNSDYLWGEAPFHLRFGTARGLILERECARDHGWPWCKIHLLPTLSIQFDLWGCGWWTLMKNIQ